MLVIGNGESPKGIDINELQCEKVGCNAIFQRSAVHHLVCCDKRMVTEAYRKRIQTRISTLEVIGKTYSGVNLVPELWYESEERIDQPWHWGSGDYAVLLASESANKNKSVVRFRPIQ